MTILRWLRGLLQPRSQEKELEVNVPVGVAVEPGHVIANGKISENFLEVELMPPGLGFNYLDVALRKNGFLLAQKLEDLRAELGGVALYINTYHIVEGSGARKAAGFRTEAINKDVGGHPNSWHKYFLAADVATSGATLQQVKAAALKVGFTEVILYEQMNFVHCAIE